MNKNQMCCKYVSNVYCNPAKMCCDKCGWNPEVAERRKQKIIEQRKGGKQNEKPR